MEYGTYATSNDPITSSVHGLPVIVGKMIVTIGEEGQSRASTAAVGAGSLLSRRKPERYGLRVVAVLMQSIAVAL